MEPRAKRVTHARIAAALGVSKSIVGRVLARAGLSLSSNLDPVEPIVRYEHEALDDTLHIDTEKLGRIERPGHRVTGNRRDSVEGCRLGDAVRGDRRSRAHRLHGPACR